MACYPCLRGWCASVGGVGGVLAWVACKGGWRGQHATMDGMVSVLTWVACYYYCYCYYWNTTLKKKMLSVNFC